MFHGVLEKNNTGTVFLRHGVLCLKLEFSLVFRIVRHHTKLFLENGKLAV